MSDAIVWLLTATIALVFLVSALSKIIDLQDFTRGVRQYRMIPWGTAPLVVRTVVLAELAVGILLVLGVAERYAAVVGLCLLAVFITAVSVAIIRHENIDCGCFGLLFKERVGLKTLFRDLALTAALGALFWADDPAPDLQRAVTGRADTITSLMQISWTVLVLGPIAGVITLKLVRDASLVKARRRLSRISGHVGGS